MWAQVAAGKFGAGGARREPFSPLSRRGARRPPSIDSLPTNPLVSSAPHEACACVRACVRACMRVLGRTRACRASCSRGGCARAQTRVDLHLCKCVCALRVEQVYALFFSFSFFFFYRRSVFFFSTFFTLSFSFRLCIPILLCVEKAGA